MSELKKQIEEALRKDVNLTKEEYKEQVLKADKATESHGIVNKRVAVSEGVRHKRIQSNFYGIALNFLSCILSAIEEQTVLLSQQNAMLYEICKKEDIDVDKLFTRADE